LFIHSGGKPLQIKKGEKTMFEFETLDGAMGLFAQLNYVGQNNCIFYGTSVQ
jgi:hypothetical protein